MGDVLTGVFGGGQQTNQTTKPDATAGALNQLRLDQTRDLFSQYGFGSFIGPDATAYQPTLQGQAISAEVSNPPDLSNLLSLDDYIKLGLDQAQNYITQIATPEILSNAALQGLDRGGAVPAAIAKATAQVGLPFVQGLPAASTALTLAPQQAALLKSQNAQTQLPIADYQRTLQEADLNRRQGILNTAYTGLPFTPGSTTKGGTSSLPLFNLFGFGGSI
jgi:hypothetical protein